MEKLQTKCLFLWYLLTFLSFGYGMGMDVALSVDEAIVHMRDVWGIDPTSEQWRAELPHIAEEVSQLGQRGMLTPHLIRLLGRLPVKNLKPSSISYMFWSISLLVDLPWQQLDYDVLLNFVRLLRLHDQAEGTKRPDLGLMITRKGIIPPGVSALLAKIIDTWQGSPKIALDRCRFLLVELKYKVNDFGGDNDEIRARLIAMFYGLEKINARKYDAIISEYEPYIMDDRFFCLLMHQVSCVSRDHSSLRLFVASVSDVFYWPYFEKEKEHLRNTVGDYPRRRSFYDQVALETSCKCFWAVIDALLDGVYYDQPAVVVWSLMLRSLASSEDEDVHAERILRVQAFKEESKHDGYVASLSDILHILEGRAPAPRVRPAREDRGGEGAAGADAARAGDEADDRDEGRSLGQKRPRDTDADSSESERNRKRR